MTDIVHTLARHFSVSKAKTMAHDHSGLTCILDMDREHVPEFLQRRLRLQKKMAAQWCDILWMDRMKEAKP